MRRLLWSVLALLLAACSGRPTETCAPSCECDLTYECTEGCACDPECGGCLPAGADLADSGETVRAPGDGGPGREEEVPRSPGEDAGAREPIGALGPTACPDVPAEPNPADQSGVGRDFGGTISASRDRHEDASYDVFRTRYDVYFGTENPPPLWFADHHSPVCHVRLDTMTCGEVGGPSFPRGTTYYWKIVAKAPTGCVTEGPVWSFSTPSNDHPSCPGAPTVVDDAGNEYRTVEIGGQCWMAENLKLGTPTAQIPFCSGESQCPGAPSCVEGQCTGGGASMVQAFCADLQPERCGDGCGAAYRWYEIMQGAERPGARGICPEGWHIPTRTDWNVLARRYGNDAGALTEFWGRSGFDAYLCGRRRDSTSNWELEPRAAFFWTSTDATSGESPTTQAYTRQIWRDGTAPDPELSEVLLSKNFALHVRCIRN